MFYTQRRAADRGPGATWVHGTDIGVAVSHDGGLAWAYDGVVTGLDPHPGRNTLWAPEIVFAEGRYHMFVSTSGAFRTGGRAPRAIHHHVSDDLRSWQLVGEVPLSSDRVDRRLRLSAAAGRVPDVVQGRGPLLDHVVGRLGGPHHVVPRTARVGAPAHEGPNVFELGGHYWMVTDEWTGLGVTARRTSDLGPPGAHPRRTRQAPVGRRARPSRGRRRRPGLCRGRGRVDLLLHRPGRPGARRRRRVARRRVPAPRRAAGARHGRSGRRAPSHRRLARLRS